MKITESWGLPFNDRKPPFSEIRLVVIHYTATETLDEALGKMAIRGVSAHYAIDVDGAVVALVPEEKRAWHVKTGCRWRGISDVNSASIGIELVNVGIEREDEGLPPRPFTAPQIAALKELIADIRRRHGPLELIGHSDADPGRKLDPGPLFPWGEFDSIAPAVGFPPDESPTAERMSRRLADLGYDADSPLAFSSFLLRRSPELWREAMAALMSRNADSRSYAPTRVDFAQSTNTRGHPQEDAILCDPENGLFAVCDGITRSVYPPDEASPAKVVADLFAKTLRDTFLAGSPSRGSKGRLAESVRAASNAVRTWNDEHLPRGGDENDFLANDLAGLVFVAVAIEGEHACIAQVGDCWADLLRGGDCVRLTGCGTDRVAEYRQSKSPGRETTIRIRRDIRNNATTDEWSRWRYGAITGETRGLWFVEWRTLPIKSGDILFLGSDGLATYWRAHVQRDAASGILRGAAASEIVAAARPLSDDDMSLLRIELE